MKRLLNVAVIAEENSDPDSLDVEFEANVPIIKIGIHQINFAPRNAIECSTLAIILKREPTTEEFIAHMQRN